MKVRIDNLVPRRDTEGAVIDAHGGAWFNRFGDTWFSYGVRYGRTDGYSADTCFVCYSSTDLVTWRPRGSVWDGTQRPGLHFRPHVLFHPGSGRYVMWFLYYERFQRAGPEKTGPNVCVKGVATADAPEGPFKPHAYGVPLSCELSGDHDLFVDDDGAAYLAHSHHDFSGGPGRGRATIRVERLADDWLGSTGEHAVVDSEGVPCEAPALFRRNGLCYCLFDRWTDRGRWGSGVRVNTAPHPLGPWTHRGNANRDEDGEVILRAQQHTVAPIQTAHGLEYLWAGDRWRSTEHLGTDFQHWELLRFADDGGILPLRSEETWTINLPM